MSHPATPSLPNLTILRGIAAWWVVLFHFRSIWPAQSTGLSGAALDAGTLAVDLFFQLSGFILFYNYGRTFNTISPFIASRFFLARFARIYPLHITILVTMVINPILIIMFSTQKNPGARYDIEYFFLSIFLVQNWTITNTIAWNVPAWSISVEAFWYILFPVIAFTINYFSRIVALSCYVLYISCYIILYFHLLDNSIELGEGIARFGLLRGGLQFMMGMALAQLQSMHGPTMRRMGRLVGTAAACLLGYWLAFHAPQDTRFVPPIWTLVIASCLQTESRDKDGSFTRILDHVGEISYSTYLVHYLIMDWIKFIFVDHIASVWSFVIYVLSVYAASIFCFIWVERPGRRYVRDRLTLVSRTGT